MADAIEDAIARLIAAGLAKSADLKGCTEQDIAALERAHGVVLPAAYRRFLRRVGKSAGRFMVGTDLLFDALPDLRAQAESLLREDSAVWTLAASDFVFAVHQGYQFLFFRTGEGDDPEVFHYEERGGDARCVAESFSDWLRMCVSDETVGVAR